jgi:hypothetical protein
MANDPWILPIEEGMRVVLLRAIKDKPLLEVQPT